MANCHNLFTQYNSNISIESKKKERLRKSKDHLISVIEKFFIDNYPDYKPQFFIQGSYKMATMIITKDNDCDLDLGVHFVLEPDIQPEALMKRVKKAVDGITNASTQIKSKCVRVIYANDYHIDLPIYKQSEDDDYPWLAIKGEEWDTEESDPRGFVQWYRDTKTDQLTRLIKCLKCWCDKVGNKMPSGLAMTLLAEEHYDEDDRDDIALRDTLIAIENDIDSWEAYMPTKPEDNVLERYSESLKDNFKEKLSSFIESAEEAIDEENQLKASKKWRKHLGLRFPLGKDDDGGSRAVSSIAAISSRSTTRPYLPNEKK